MEKIEPTHFRDVVRFFRGMQWLVELDCKEVRPGVDSAVPHVDKRELLVLNYDRAAITMELLAKLSDTRHFQAIAVLTRSIFELAVEVRLLSITPDAVVKIKLFDDVQKLRTARNIVAYAHKNLGVVVHWKTQEEFILQRGKSIDDAKNRMWPNKTGIQRRDFSHWTLKNLRIRAKELGEPFTASMKLNTRR